MVFLYNVYVNVGFFLGEWVDVEVSSLDLESDDEDLGEEGVRNFEDDWRKLKKLCCWKWWKIMSDLIKNIESNYKMWLEVIK